MSDSYNYYTEDLTKFGSREIAMLADIFKAWCNHGLPDDFENDSVKPAMNMGSGYVFLVNSECECAMMNGDKLESFYTTPHSGEEGFLDELLERYDDMHHEDKEYIDNIRSYRNE